MTLSQLPLRTSRPFLTWGLLLACGLQQAWADESARTSNRPLTLPEQPPVQVQDSVLPFRQFDRVEITGSSIVRKQQTEALPVQVITRDDILKRGLGTVVEVLQRLPLMMGFNDASQMSETIGGYANAGLHGLPNGTLVLIDGQRMAPYGRQSLGGYERSGVEIGQLPLMAVERIEILTDGASTRYGTDAMAGVVNIITRPSIRGVELQASRSLPDREKGAGWRAGLAAGKGRLAADGYQLTLAADLQQREALMGADRPEASQGRYFFDHAGKTWSVDGGLLSHYTSPASLLSYTPTAVFASPGLYQDGACPPGYVALIGQPACQSSPYGERSVYPALAAARLAGRLDVALESDQTVYVQWLYADIRERGWIDGWPSAFLQLGQLRGQTGYELGQQAGFLPKNPQYLLWRPSGIGMREREYQQRNGRLAAGLKGLLQGWDYHASAYHAQSDVHRTQESLNTSTVRFGNGGLLTLDNVMQPLTPDNPLYPQLQALRMPGLLDRGRTTLDALEIRASRTLAEIDGRDVLLGLGADRHQERADFTPGLSQQPAFDGQRTLLAAHLELHLPLTETLDLIPALRHDRYSDVGTTSNAKLAVRWRLNPAWVLRGSTGSGFRAPTLGQTREQPQAYYLSSSRLRMTCSGNDARATELREIASALGGRCADGLFEVYTNGNRELQPETARHSSMGLAFSPTRNLTLAADYWHVRIANQLGLLPETEVLASPQHYAPQFMLDRDKDLAVITPPVNRAITVRAGMDFEARWRQPTGWGLLTTVAQGTWMHRSWTRQPGDTAKRSDLGGYNILSTSVTPRLQGRLSSTLVKGDWQLQAGLNHTAGYIDAPIRALGPEGVQAIVDRRVKAWNTLDLTVARAIDRQWQWRVNVTNLLNTAAPLSFAQTTTGVFGANTQLSQLWGRTVHLEMSGRF